MVGVGLEKAELIFNVAWDGALLSDGLYNQINVVNARKLPTYYS